MNNQNQPSCKSQHSWLLRAWREILLMMWKLKSTIRQVTWSGKSRLRSTLFALLRFLAVKPSGFNDGNIWRCTFSTIIWACISNLIISVCAENFFFFNQRWVFNFHGQCMVEQRSKNHLPMDSSHSYHKSSLQDVIGAHAQQVHLHVHSQCTARPVIQLFRFTSANHNW